VKVNSRAAKAATLVRAGDRVEARLGDRDRVVEVVRLIDKRVGAPLATACLVDLSPPPRRRGLDAPAPRRDPGTGRPTKKDRRQLERFRRR
jgi:ribosome-associated heat shock protein Hsp15